MIQTNFDMMRERLEKAAGLLPLPKPKFRPSDLVKLEQTEWSPEFERLMRNRLLMGALRYGTFEEKGIASRTGNHWDLVGALKKKVEGYEQTGNTEYLVDAANYLLLAFEFDPHPKKHFHALDDHSDHCQRARDITKGNTPTRVGSCHGCGKPFAPKEPIHQYHGRNYHKTCVAFKHNVPTQL